MDTVVNYILNIFVQLKEKLYHEAFLEENRKEKGLLVLERFTHLKCNSQPE